MPGGYAFAGTSIVDLREAMADSWSTAKPCDLEVLLSAVDCFPKVPASPLPGARRSQDCSFEGLLNSNGEINEPQSHPFGPSQSVHQCEEEAFYTQHHVWCPGSILNFENTEGLRFPVWAALLWP